MRVQRHSSSTHGRGRQSIPASIAGLSVIAWQPVPVRACHPVQIVDDYSLSNRQLAREFLSASQPGAVHIDEAEVAFLESKYRDISHSAWCQVPRFFVPDLSRR